jgi:hypothetical protein
LELRVAWTQAEIDTLKAAIASGVLSVAYSDRTVTYKSTDDQLKALALMEREVQGANAVGFRLAAVDKGL